MEPPKSVNTPVASTATGIIGSGAEKRWSLLKKFQEKTPYYGQGQDKVRSTKRGLLSISTSGTTSSTLPSSSPPVKVRGMKGNFRLSDDRPSSDLGKGSVKMRPTSRPLTSDAGPVGVITASNAGGAMRKMLEGLHNTRTRLERNQRSYERTRHSLEEMDKQTSKMRIEYQKAAEKWSQLTESAALKMTELTCVEISDKVLNETLGKTEEELHNDLEELFKIRMETSRVSSDFLNEAISSGMLWNGTSVGQQNRTSYWKEEFDSVDRYKQQLEQELSDFLMLLKGIEDSMRNLDEEKKKLEEDEISLIKQEREIQGRLDELDTAVNDIIREENEFVQSSEEECEKLRREIEEAKNKTSFLQDKGNEARTTIKAQKIPVKSKLEVPPNNESQHQTRNEIEIVYCDPSINLPDKKNNEGKGFKFQAPVKSQAVSSSPPKNSLNQRQSFDNEEMENSQIDGDDICMAAATAFSQSIRTYEPLTPMPVYPAASKVRVVENQVPLIGFMRQLSSAKVIKRPPKITASQAKSTQKSAPVAVPKAPPAPAARPHTSSGKLFQFKKKTSSSILSSVNEEKENCSTSFNKSNSEFSDALNNSHSSHYTTATSFLGEDDAMGADFESNNKTGASVYNRPYAQFNSSRILLSESQEDKLIGK